SGRSGGASRPGAPWYVEMAIAYLRRFYADLDDCIEWSAYHHVAAPQSMSWSWAPVKRHGLTVPGIDGLLLAGATIEAPAGIVDISAWAGREAARRALGLLVETRPRTPPHTPLA